MEIIHIVLGKANPERMNGVNKVVYQLATEQANSGRTVSVWGITENKDHNYPPRTFDTKLFPVGKNKFSIDSSLKKAIATHAKGAVFHLHGGWIPAYWAVKNSIKKHGGTYVITPHGAYNTIAMKKSSFTKKVYFQLFEKSILKNALKIHCIGSSEKEGLSKIFRTTNCHLLPYGYTSDFDGKMPVKDTKNFIIGFVGRLDVYTKGLDLLTDAFHIFRKEHPNCELWIVGDGPEKNQFELDLYKNRKLSGVKLCGAKYGGQKFNLMYEMHVFAHPSRNEGLPASILEAADMGIPCIASAATNVAEIIEECHAGIKISNESVPQLVEAISNMYAKWTMQGHLNICGNNAIQMVKSHFSWPILIPKYDQMYGIPT